MAREKEQTYCENCGKPIQENSYLCSRCEKEGKEVVEADEDGYKYEFVDVP